MEKFSKTEGFIVAPFESSKGGYDASYGNANKTNRSFKTLRLAKLYLKKHGMKTAMYDSPSGTKTLNVEGVIRKAKLKSKIKSSRFGVPSDKDILKGTEMWS